MGKTDSLLTTTNGGCVEEVIGNGKISLQLSLSGHSLSVLLRHGWDKLIVISSVQALPSAKDPTRPSHS